MSENTTEAQGTEVRSIQSYRHEARRTLANSRQSLSIRTPETKAVYTLVNGTIEAIIAGRPGLTQEQQVQRLTEALETVEGNKEKIAEAVATAKEAVLEVVNSWDTVFAQALESAQGTLAEAREVAETRDFDAWQEQKGRRGNFFGGTPESTDEDADEDDNEDDEDE